MDKLLTIFIFGLIGGFTFVESLDCSNVVTEINHGVLNWLGEIKFTVPVSTDASGWSMFGTFDQEFTGVGTWDVWSTQDGKEKWVQYTNKDDNAVLNQGDEYEFNFRVNYFTNVTKPQVDSLKFQGIELCLV